VPLFVLLALGLVLGIVLIAVVMQRLVLRPLQLMTDSANRIAAGNYSLSLPDHRRDEMGDLARAFNHMTDRVREYTTALEEKVANRTHELQELNEHMSESIRYASLLQHGLMPSRDRLAERLTTVSLFHRQRDGVGGDALFLRDTAKGFLLAVIDCEGHGVSGALMTMTVDSMLKLITSQSELQDDPAGTLTELEDAIRTSLRPEATVNVGLEIALCAYNRDHGRLSFAGAGMPLYLRDLDGRVHTVKGRRKTIGGRRNQAASAFENHILDTDGRGFALVTDGYVDQVGGPEGRAFGTRRLNEMMGAWDPSTTGEPGPTKEPGPTGEPGLEWERVFDDYKGEHLQRDDVLAIAFTV
jgi:serine phosphatase RsbU (regulator of sigma subunit)